MNFLIPFILMSIAWVIAIVNLKIVIDTSVKKDEVILLAKEYITKLEKYVENLEEINKLLKKQIELL